MCDLEYIAASEASKEAIWIKNFIGDLGVVSAIKKPMEIFCDNEGVVALAKYHFIRHQVEGLLVMKGVSLAENPTDPLTKGLSRVKHLQHAKRIGLKDDTSFND